MKRPLIFSTTLLSLCCFACGSDAPTRAPVARLGQPIEGGQYDPDHTSVVGMYMMKGNYGGGMCSGTLIAPNLVLTARHCVASISPDSELVMCGQSTFGAPVSGSNVFVSTDMQLSQQGTWYPGSKVFVPPESNEVCGYDMALVILAESLPVPPTVPRIDIEPTEGEIYAAVGFGQTGTGWGGSRMVRSGLSVVCGAGACTWGGAQSSEFQGETGVCQGDSGGPALDEKSKVIGVASRGSDGCETPVYGAVSAWGDWIMEVALQAAQEGGYEPPFWATTGKSDPPDPPPPGTGGTGGSGGEGGVGGTPPATGGSGSQDPQGLPCGVGQGCPSGYACLSTDVPDQGHCTATCDATRACGGGLTCDLDLGVCAAGPSTSGSSGDSGGCSVADPSERGPAKPVPWVAGLLGLALVARRRRAASR